MARTTHVPVLLEEAIKYLNPGPNKNYIDGTVGLGGHAERILELNGPRGILVGFDLDQAALSEAEKRLAKYKKRVYLFNNNYAKVKKIIHERFPNHKFDGLLLDLGLSSLQLQSGGRGFTFQADEPLDMRFGSGGSITAAELLNTWPERDIEKIIKEFGEERYAREIARTVVTERKKEKLRSTGQLTEIISAIYANKPKPKNIHYATKTFQALRIAVNDELNNLKRVLPQTLEIIRPKGRVAVISFHSLEDRITKRFFKKESSGCICPPEMPVCQCGHKKRIVILTKKAVVPGPEEIKSNYRSRSAKMRVAEIL